MEQHCQKNEIKSRELAITELFEKLRLSNNNPEPIYFNRNNEVYNPYSNTHKVTFSADTKVK